MELDHVVVAVSDLDTAAHVLRTRYGLATVEGGRHPDWGTANRVVPLGATYLELVAVADERTATGNAFGRWIAASSGGPLGWAVRSSPLEAVAARLGLEIAPGSRETATGEVLRWRIAGIAEAAAEPCLPFFIEWGRQTPFPGRTHLEHPCGRARLVRIELEGDVERTIGWLGVQAPFAVIRPGRPRVGRAVLEVDGSEFTLEGGVG